MTRFAKAAVEPTARRGRGIESSTRMEDLMVSQGHRLFLHRRHRSLWEIVIRALRRIRAAARPGRSKRSRAGRITERLPSAVASATAAITIRIDDLGYEAVVVQGEFGARQYREVFDMLQATPGNKVLDLRDAGISSDAFNALAVNWRAPRGQVPRIAIVLDFAHWVVFRNHAGPALESLATNGVVAAVAYEDQTRGMGLVSWFAGGPLPHNVP